MDKYPGASKFLSTPSARRATPADGREGVYRKISIHALREEGDIRDSELSGEDCDFYPRPPRGGRQELPIPFRVMSKISIHALREEGDRADRSAGDTMWLFLSTPSARRATAWQVYHIASFEISIHALREEGD